MEADNLRNNILTYRTFDREDFFFMSLYSFFLLFYKVFPVFFQIKVQKQKVFYLIEDLIFRQKFSNAYIFTGLLFGIITNFGNLKWRIFYDIGSVMKTRPNMVVNVSPKRYVFKEAFLTQTPSFGVTTEDYSPVTYGLFGSMFNPDLQYIYLTFFLTFSKVLENVSS